MIGVRATWRLFKDGVRVAERSKPTNLTDPATLALILVTETDRAFADTIHLWMGPADGEPALTVEVPS